MHFNIQVLCSCYLMVLVSSTIANPLNGTDHPNISIVGGVPAKAGEFPYLARLLIMPGAQLCGGTLIGPYHILTAAHCPADNGSSVFLNTLSINGGGPGSVNRTVKKYIKHENYRFFGKNKTYDIAILVLNAPVTNLSFAKLPTQSSSYVNKSAVVAGWGATEFMDVASPVLLKTNVTVLDNKKCSASYPSGKTIFVGSLMLCANAPPNKDTCTGDSGGPILVNGIQIGITSYGANCGQVNSPGVYTRITALLDWIASTRAKNPK